jgi:2,5-diketo-D-gluconate reductase B
MEHLKTQGISVPRLGLGTFRMQGDVCQAAVESALELGYRHIDTAEMYGNEDAVGAAIAASGIARDNLHVTTKAWHTNLASDAIERAVDASLRKLGLAYVDLYMIHWPARDMDLPAMFDTLVRVQAEGRIRAIGVCNFTLDLLRTVVEKLGAPIAFNQIEYHVLLDQTPVRSYLSRHAIPVMAHCPLAQGTLAEHPELMSIASKHGTSPAQVALKWLLDQDGVAVIPKAQRRASQQANLDAMALTLDEDDRRMIAALPKNQRFVNPPFAPAWDASAA